MEIKWHPDGVEVSGAESIDGHWRIYRVVMDLEAIERVRLQDPAVFAGFERTMREMGFGQHLFGARVIPLRPRPGT